MAHGTGAIPHPHATKQHRPRAVSFVASLLLFEAVVLAVLVGVLSAGTVVASIELPAVAPDSVFGPLLAMLPGLGLTIVVGVTAVNLALAGLGLLRLHEWGWVLAMAIHGIMLANALFTHLTGTPQHLQLALCSIVVLVLHQREVRQAFTRDVDHG